jgi:tetratricopeptide (TPR) repeat protein
MAHNSDWQRVADLASEAVQVAPTGANPSADFAKFRAILPMSNLCSGRREEAVRLWEQELVDHPRDLLTIHSLALLHYWWARAEEITGNTNTHVARWKSAIQYWYLLQQTDGFWDGWAQARSQTWGFSISAEDIAKLREKIPEEQFIHRFQDRLDDLRQKGAAQLATAYTECMTAALLEKRSSRCWKKAIQFVPAGEGVSSWLKRMEPWRANARKPAPGGSAAWSTRFVQKSGSATSPSQSQTADGLLDLSGGIGFFTHFGLLPCVADMARCLETVSGTVSCIADLRILFSPDGLGTVLVAIEDRNAYDEAVAQLNALPTPVKGLAEFTYLHSLALLRQAEQLSGHGNAAGALEHWRKAYELARHGSVDETFSKLVLDIAASAKDQAIAVAVKEAKKQKTAGKTDAAILLLESWRTLDKDGVLLDHICIHLCDRAGESIAKKNYDAARKDFQRVLELKPGYERAKQGMATTYNNEGCAERNADKSIALFENALKWEPSSHQVKSNLASELVGKAVSRVNAASGTGVRYAVDEAVRLLERAYGLVSHELKDGALAMIQSMAELDSDLAEKFTSQLRDEVLKRVITNLATVYHMRARIRRGF